MRGHTLAIPTKTALIDDTREALDDRVDGSQIQLHQSDTLCPLCALVPVTG